MKQNRPITLRAATAADQVLITHLIRQARLNPIGLKWPNFLIAERAEERLGAVPRVVGIGQLRPHGDGILELASLVVVEQERGGGVGSLLVHALINKADRPLFLMCEGSKVGYYERFDFMELTDPNTFPRSIRTFYRIAKVMQWIAMRFGRELPYLAIMAHRGHPAAE